MIQKSKFSTSQSKVAIKFLNGAIIPLHFNDIEEYGRIQFKIFTSAVPPFRGKVGLKLFFIKNKRAPPVENGHRADIPVTVFNHFGIEPIIDVVPIRAEHIRNPNSSFNQIDVNGSGSDTALFIGIGDRITDRLTEIFNKGLCTINARQVF